MFDNRSLNLLHWFKHDQYSVFISQMTGWKSHSRCRDFPSILSCTIAVCELVSWEAIVQNHPKWHLLWATPLSNSIDPGPPDKTNSQSAWSDSSSVTSAYKIANRSPSNSKDLLVGSFGQPQPWMQCPEPPRPHRAQCLHLGRDHTQKRCQANCKYNI